VKRLRHKILIVDHDERLLIDLERVLQEEGFDTTTTWDPREAVTLLKFQKFELLLVGDHPQFAPVRTEYCSRLKNTPWIVLQSAPVHPFAAPYSRWLGACSVVPKWNSDELILGIQECFSHDDETEEIRTRQAAA
jgi:DNA-binding NtrC family response regulator